MIRTIIVTPANDLDSIFSYAILSKAFGYPLHVYCELSNHERTKEKILTELEKEKGAIVIFADCTLNNSCMKEISQKARPGTIVVFDHHPDVIRNCSGFVWAGEANTAYSSTLRAILEGCTFPAEFRGNAELFALLTENDFTNSTKFLARAVKKMIFAETTYGKQTSARLQTAIDLLDPKNEKWEAIYKSIPQCIQEDENEKKMAAHLAPQARVKTVNGINTHVVYLATDAIDKVYANLPAATALIGWKLDTTGNMVRCRIRSRDGSAYKIATYLGGSGHANAAAADMTLEYFFTNVMLGEKEVVTKAPDRNEEFARIVSEHSAESIRNGSGHAEAVNPQKKSPPIPVTLILSKPPAKKRILRPSSLPLEKNKDVLQAFSVIREAYNSPMSDLEMQKHFGGVTSVQNCIGQARSLSKELLGKDRPFVGYLYIMAYKEFGQDFDKTDAMIRKNFAKPQTKAILEDFKPKSPVDPRILRILMDLVLSETPE